MALVAIMIGLVLFANTAQAGGPWHDQYCDVETTQIRVVDQDGNVLESKVEEKVVCNDGASDFLEGMGIADNCEIFTWWMPLGIGLPALKLIILFVLTSIEKKRLLNLR